MHKMSMILSAILCSLNVLSPYAVTVHKIFPCYSSLQLCLNTIVLWVNMSRWQRMRFWEMQSNVDLTTALIPSLMTSFRQWHLSLDRISMRSSQQSSRKIHGTNSSLRHLQLKSLFCHKCPKRAKTRTFRRLRKSLIALLIVVCGKSI